MSAEASQTPSNATDAGTDVRIAFPAPFGSYLLLHRIGRGGMGDVYLAKTGGVMGIEKHCVVKTLRARYSDDAEYVERFVAEARLVVQLSHRNIAQVFDVGRVGGSFYLAMELVLGRNVRAVLDELDLRALPPAGAAHIAAELLDALDYAHRAVDASTGEPLHLVHRDVSPQNVLVSFEGEVKLIDFGLAETGRQITSDHSMSGSQEVMGKLAYMAPEQARGEIVDARADQFAAAIVIYEMFANERYYAGFSSHDVWRAAGLGTHVPRRFGDLDRELRDILARALAPEKSARYPSCGEFRDAILAYCRDQRVPHGGPLLRKLMNEMFGADLEATRELLRRFAMTSAKPQPSLAPVSAPASSTDFFSIATSTHAKTLHDPTQIFAITPSTAVLDDERPRSRGPLVALAATALVALGAMGFVFTQRNGEIPAPPPIVATPAPQKVPPPPPPPQPVIEPKVEPIEPEPTPVVKRRRPRPAAGPLTLADKLALLKRCDDACAAPILKWEGRLGDHPDIVSFKKSLEACSRKCASR